MKCDEAELLQGAYLDSELDARTTLLLDEHVKSCPDCGRRFAEERTLEARLKSALNQGSATSALWSRIEEAVTTAAPSGSRSGPARPASQVSGSPAMWSAVGEQLLAGLRRSRWAWAGLGAAWAVILLLNASAREPQGRLAAGQSVPSVPELRLAWKQKQLLMSELAAVSEPAPARTPTATSPKPRSQRANQTPNA